MSDQSWRISGDYYESCSCDPGCPCLFNSPPTQGHCTFLFAFHIRRGSYGSVNLDGANLAGFIHSPGPMWEGNYTEVLYIDDGLTDEQHEVLERIFTGQAGGSSAFRGLFGDLVSDYRGSHRVPVRIDTEEHRFSVLDVLEVEVEYIEGVTGEVPKIVDADFIDEHLVGRAVSSTYSGEGGSWDITGGHAFLSSFDLRGP